MLNHTTIQGRFVRDPELRATQKGTPVASFTIAWSEKYQDTEQKVFMPCVAWGKLGEFASKYFVKGQEAVVEGKLITRQWQDKNGNNRETIELIADHVHFCGPKQDSGYQSSGYQGGGVPAGGTMGGFTPLVGYEDEGDLPF